ncbi:MAG: hypothetical protein ABFD89_05500 [Bryobacteraceae bacterium]
MRVHLLSFQTISFFFQYRQRPKLIGLDVRKADSDAQLQRCSNVNGLAE